MLVSSFDRGKSMSDLLKLALTARWAHDADGRLDFTNVGKLYGADECVI